MTNEPNGNVLHEDTSLLMSNPNILKKKCLYCEEAIPKTSKKCKFCGSFQTWRRHLSFGATIISLTLGVIATYGLASEPIKDWLKPNYRMEVVKMPVAGEDTYNVYITNSGRKTFSLSYVWASNEESFQAMKTDLENRTFMPGESRLVKFKIDYEGNGIGKVQNLELQRRVQLFGKSLFTEHNLQRKCAILIKTVAQGTTSPPHAIIYEDWPTSGDKPKPKNIEECSSSHNMMMASWKWQVD